ncbi:pilus assembly protein TadG-related protein [Amphritea sp. HPY]|uniref:pilus assembly protein TadG-related protein n=1 Tax=Amphritea sp. HPY TaxID=3421652 RepID=UPI003D7E3C16
MKTKNAFWKSNFSAAPSQFRQRGIVAVIVTVGIVALLAVTGLALDSGHMLMNKTRIQNAVDAAALAAARTLQTTDGDMTEARTTADTTFNNNLSDELTTAAPTVTVTFSETLNPGSFFAAVAAPRFVKVSSSTVALDSVLVQVIGKDSKNVLATAVAGYANGADVCNLIPVMVCAKSPPSPLPDGETADDYFHGYKTFQPGSYDASTDLITLKMGSGDGPDEEVGTGSFHLIDLPGMQGANDIRYAFAGNPACAALSEPLEIDLAPGNKVGPTTQGINTRFGMYDGALNGDSDLYPPDFANENVGDPTCGSGSVECGDPEAYYSHYQSNSFNSGSQRFERRIVGVPIANCVDSGNGNNTPASMQEPQGIGCFMLTEPAVQTGGADDDGGSGSLTGVFMKECPQPAVGVTTSSGVDIIVLYKNPDGDDS